MKKLIAIAVMGSLVLIGLWWGKNSEPTTPSIIEQVVQQEPDPTIVPCPLDKPDCKG